MIREDNSTKGIFRDSEKTPTNKKLSDLPEDIKQNEIYFRTPLKMLGLLARTSKDYEKDTAFLRLLPAALNAAPEFLDSNKSETALAAIAILKKHPELLFIEKQVKDHYGREILGSPYKIFLGAGDLWAIRQIQKYILPLIKNGEAQAEVQFKEQFPNCPWPQNGEMIHFSEEMLHDDRNKEQIEVIKKQLATVKQLIDNDPFTYYNHPRDSTKQAVEMLCKLFQPKLGEVIRSGLHFPLAIIGEIYKTYEALLQPQHHRPFFSLAVIKPALEALSTVDGQCCQYGWQNLDMEKGPSRRCDSSYQHPLGKPLSFKFIPKSSTVALVDPHTGDVHFDFPNSSYFRKFHIFDKHACCVGESLGNLNPNGHGPRRLDNLLGSKAYNLCSLTESLHTDAMDITKRIDG